MHPASRQVRADSQSLTNTHRASPFANAHWPLDGIMPCLVNSADASASRMGADTPVLLAKDSRPHELTGYTISPIKYYALGCGRGRLVVQVTETWKRRSADPQLWSSCGRRLTLRVTRSGGRGRRCRHGPGHGRGRARRQSPYRTPPHRLRSEEPVAAAPPIFPSATTPRPPVSLLRLALLAVWEPRGVPLAPRRSPFHSVEPSVGAADASLFCGWH